MTNLNTDIEHKPEFLLYNNILPYSNMETIIKPIQHDLDTRKTEYFNMTIL